MATDLGSSFHEQYMAINTKLKKRFMRKPNISEATNEFIALAIQCENAEQPAFAGQCYVGAAKCEATAGNFLGEAEQYIAAARQFMKAEKKLKQLKFYSPDRENLEGQRQGRRWSELTQKMLIHRNFKEIQFEIMNFETEASREFQTLAVAYAVLILVQAAIGCYMQALPKYPEKSPIRTSILMELAEHLIFLNHKKEALCYYEQALELVEDRFRRLMHMRTLLNLQMDCELFDQALQTANQMCEELPNMPGTLLSELQVSRILLALHVDPAEEDKPVSLAQLFKDLMDESTGVLPLNTDLHLKLQSVVLSCTTADVPALISVSVELKQHLTTQQVNLLDHLVRSQQMEYLSLG